MTDIRTPPPSKAFLENFDSIFGWKCRRCGTTNESKADACHDCKQPRALQFCAHCGAGLGEHFRLGEGTCEHCDPKGERGFQGGVMEPPDDSHDWCGFSCGEYGNDFRCSRCKQEMWIEGTGSFRGRGLPEKGCPGNG